MKRVAVTGLGVISPVGNDVPTFWNALCSGTCGIGPITKFDATDYPVKLAAEVRDFDPKQYMEKLDILHSDVYTHFAMAAACQAVADSGIAGTLDAERVGVYIGSGIGGIATFMTEHSKLLNRGPRRVSPYFIPMMIPNMASSMIAMRYHFHGPAMPMVTACASGTNAIGEALRLIRHGYADAMVAGGAEATVNALAAAGFSNMQALSPSEDPNAASLPFDVRRAGFVMGEGAGVLVLEELEHAKQRGATIYAELTGYGSTCDAYHITSPDPSAAESARAIADAVLGTLDLETVTEADRRAAETEAARPSVSTADTVTASASPHPTPPEQENPSDTPETFYRVQTGLFRIRQNADRMLYDLLDQGYPAFLLAEDGFFKVQVGAYRQLGNAILMERRLRRDGYSTLITT